MSGERLMAGSLAAVASFGLWAIVSPVRADEPKKPVFQVPAAGKHAHHHHAAIEFDKVSARTGNWSDPQTWQPSGVPKDGQRVKIARDTRVTYDVASEARIRLIQVVGTLTFARDRDTLLNVGLLKVQNSDECSEGGFHCDFRSVNAVGEPHARPEGTEPALEIGTLDAPLPAQFTARIRLHWFEGMNKDDAPAIACCSARMDLHGAPLSRTWLDLGADANPGDAAVTLSEDVTGWRVGDEVLVTGGEQFGSSGGNFRRQPDKLSSETRKIARIEGRTLTLDAPLAKKHFGTGTFRSEVANLSRNVVVESADPAGVRGHTIYHRFSRGGLSYARFAHLGKEGVLGRYAIHFHLVGDTMRGSAVTGNAVVDSHNRWVTVHGTEYLVVRDNVGFRSVGHGFFLEDGTEVYNVFDRNLGVQAFRGRRLPKQVLPFDPNDGAAFWWSNGKNAFVRNTSCENDEYGFRYDSQKNSGFDSRLPIRTPDGTERVVDIRTIPQFRFEDNEAHTEGLYGMVFAGTDRAAPDERHPHRLKNLRIWEVHYGLRTEVPVMLVEDVHIHEAVYGVYRPALDRHVYRNLTISHPGSEPFNRGHDDSSVQHGVTTVDGLTFVGRGYPGIPLIQISDDNPEGIAESHFRHVKVVDAKPREGRQRALVDEGGGARVKQATDKGVPIYLHDWFGPGRHAKVVTLQDKQSLGDGREYRSEAPLTGDRVRVAEVADVPFPQPLDPVDDEPPATIVTWVGLDPTTADGRTLLVRGTTIDDVRTKRVTVNGIEAACTDGDFYGWEARIPFAGSAPLELTARSEDAAGNVEKTPHVVRFTPAAR